MKGMNRYSHSKTQLRINELSRNIKDLKVVSKKVEDFWDIDIILPFKKYQGFETTFISHEDNVIKSHNSDRFVFAPVSKEQCFEKIEESWFQPLSVLYDENFCIDNPLPEFSLKSTISETINRLNEIDSREAKALAKNLKLFLKKYSLSGNVWYLFKAVEFVKKHHETYQSRIKIALYQRKLLLKTFSKRFFRNIRDHFRRIIWYMFKNMDSEDHANVCKVKIQQTLTNLLFGFKHEQKTSYRTS